MKIEKLTTREMVRIDHAIGGRLMAATQLAFGGENKLHELDVQVGQEGDGTWAVTVTGLRSEEHVAWSHTYHVAATGLSDPILEALTEVALRCQMMASLRAGGRS